MSTTENKIPVTLSVQAPPGSLVYVAGDFKDGQSSTVPMTDIENNGTFQATLNLARGSYEYKFIINGIWCADPNCPRWNRNLYGSLNSVLEVE